MGNAAGFFYQRSRCCRDSSLPKRIDGLLVGNLSISVPTSPRMVQLLALSLRVSSATAHILPGVFQALFLSLRYPPTISFSIDFMCSNEAFIMNTWCLVTLPTNASLIAPSSFSVYREQDNPSLLVLIPLSKEPLLSRSRLLQRYLILLMTTLHWRLPYLMYPVLLR